jgi:hypothetical protein
MTLELYKCYHFRGKDFVITDVTSDDEEWWKIGKDVSDVKVTVMIIKDDEWWPGKCSDEDIPYGSFHTYSKSYLLENLWQLKRLEDNVEAIRFAKFLKV